MEKMTLAGQYHDQAQLIGSGDDFGVADGATGLDDTAHASGSDRFQTIPEWKEGIAGPRPPPSARPSALRAASSLASTRLCWPAPIPQATPSLTTTIALDLVRAQT